MRFNVPFLCKGHAKRDVLGWLLGATLFLSLAMNTPALGASDDASGAPTVILLLLDRVGLKDITGGAMPSVRNLVRFGGAGLLNARTGGGRIQGAHYVTLGAGERAVAGDASGLAFDIDEVYAGQSVTNLFESLSGEDAANAAIIHLGAAQLRQLEGAQDRPFTSGRLGEALRLAGMPVAVYGNADTYNMPQRFGTLVAMDRMGRVPAGRVGADTLLDDPSWPFGLRTDYDGLLELVLQHIDEPGLVVVDFGDLARLEGMAGLLAAGTAMAHRETALERIDMFVAELVDALDGAAGEQYVLVVVPQPPERDVAAGYLLTPAILARFPAGGTPGDGLGSGLLTSPTTRREGLGTNTDVAPTILSLLDVDEPGWVGRTLSVVPVEKPWDRLNNQFDQITRIHSQRLPVIQPYFFVQLAAVLITTGVLLFHSMVSRHLGWITRIAWRLHLALIAFPFALLLLPLLPPSDSLLLVWGQIFALVIMLSLAASWAGRWGGPIFSFTLLCTATAVALWVDAATGASLMQRSHLGYDPIGGSRFYGIGNEYMGVLIGTAAIAAGGWLDKVLGRGGDKRWGPLAMVGLGFAAIVFILASPAHGVNFGGTIAAVIGFGALGALFIRGRITWQSALITLFALVGVVVVASIYDLGAMNEGHSHVGGAIQQVSRGGSDPLWTIFERKLAVNARLIRLTIWSRAFFISLIAAMGLMIYPPRLMRRLLIDHPYLGHAIRGSLIAALAALIVNDSGIVAAATLMIPVVSTLLYLMLDRAMPPEESRV